MPLPRPEPGNGKWWVVGGVGIGAMVALIVWMGLAGTKDAVVPNVVSFEVLSDSQVFVTFNVHRPTDRDVTCTVTALNDRFAPVGTLEVPVEASSDATVQQQVSVRTVARAVSVDITRCDVVP